MKNRLALSILLLLALAAGLYAFWPKASTSPTVKTGEQPAPAPRKQTQAAASQSASSPAPEIELPKPQSQRDEKVLGQLKTFIDRTKDMTADSVQAEQEHIKEAIKDALAKETEVPKSQLITDETGEQWERLEFHNGQVRYRPVPKQEKIQ